MMILTQGGLLLRFDAGAVPEPVPAGVLVAGPDCASVMIASLGQDMVDAEGREAGHQSDRPGRTGSAGQARPDSLERLPMTSKLRPVPSERLFTLGACSLWAPVHSGRQPAAMSVCQRGGSDATRT
jgi:hypothetical protein